MRTASFVAVATLAGEAVAIVAPLHRRSAEQNPSPITGTLHGFFFDVEVQIGSQTFYLLVDTGTSDTWVAKTGYTCVQPTSNITVDLEVCNWTNTYNASSSLRYVPNQNLGVRDVSISSGKLAYENITIGGITVSNQTFGIVDRTFMIGDGLSSGVLGLGLPTLTYAFPANRRGNITTLLAERIIYDPPFVSMFKKDLIEPWYSIALERLSDNKTSGPGGWLGLGELPSVDHTDDWAVAPIELTENFPSYYFKGEPEITTFALTVDSVSWGLSSSPSTSGTSFQARVLSTVDKNHLPAEIADAINSQFEPPAVFREMSQDFTVDCNAKAPDFAVIIDDHTFWLDPKDLIAVDNFSENRCYSTIARSAEGLNNTGVNILGSAFLKNVVSVFDFGKEELRFAARSTSEGSKPPPSSTPDSGSSRLLNTGLYLCLALVGSVAASILL